MKVKTQYALQHSLLEIRTDEEMNYGTITEFGEDKVTFKTPKAEDTTTSVSGLNPITW